MDFNKAPKASEVIRAIQRLIDKHGDLPVCADDADTAWRLRIGIVFDPAGDAGIWGEQYPDRFEIKTEYHEMPEGLIGEPDNETI